MFNCRVAGWAVVIFAMALTAVGCGPENPLGRLPISGTVTFEGEPLDQGFIEFSPTENNPNIASGDRVENGRFQIPAHLGLTPGTYLVRISSAEETGEVVEPEFPGAATSTARERIPPEYNIESDQRITVTAEGPNTFQFDIK